MASDQTALDRLCADLNGHRCDRLLCLEYWHDGELDDRANVIFLQFEGTWHRLFFDAGFNYWRPHENAPESFEAPKIRASYRLTDLGETYGLRGARLKSCSTAPIPGGCELAFQFEGGKSVVFENIADRTTYRSK